MTEPAGRAPRPPGGPPPRGPRPHFTGRAAVLAVVLCGIALSLAYPVREYISQRRQIDQMQAQSAQISLHLKRLQAQDRQLSSPAYIEEQARDRLHMCLPTQMCYVIVGEAPGRKAAARRRAGMPWYARMWSSVQQANTQQASGSAGKRQSARTR